LYRRGERSGRRCFMEVFDMSEQHLSEINNKLTELKGFIEKHVSLTEERLINQRKTLDRHSAELYGEGHDDSPGMKTKLDRLVETEKTRKIVIMGVITTLIGLVVNAFWKLLGK